MPEPVEEGGALPDLFGVPDVFLDVGPVQQ
jgi:hypothetical protein